MSHLIVGGTEIPVPYQTRLDDFHELAVKKRPEEARVVQIILHHDAALSANGCFSALKSRGLSTHFCIDNDGTIVQYADPLLDWCYHGRGKVITGRKRKRPKEVAFNEHSIGIDISNAVLLRYRDRYKIPRPTGAFTVNGVRHTGLLPYEWQINNCISLIQFLLNHIPTIGRRTRIDLRWKGDITPETPGIFGHLHINPEKFDPFGFPFRTLALVLAGIQTETII